VLAALLAANVTDIMYPSVRENACFGRELKLREGQDDKSG